MKGGQIVRYKLLAILILGFLGALSTNCSFPPVPMDVYKEPQFKIEYPKGWEVGHVGLGDFSVALFSSQKIHVENLLELQDVMDTIPFFLIMVFENPDTSSEFKIIQENDLGANEEFVERHDVTIDEAKGELAVVKGKHFDETEYYLFYCGGQRDDHMAVVMFGYAPKGERDLRVFRYMSRSFRFTI